MTDYSNLSRLQKLWYNFWYGYIVFYPTWPFFAFECYPPEDEEDDEMFCAGCARPMSAKHPKYNICCSFSCSRDFYN